MSLNLGRKKERKPEVDTELEALRSELAISQENLDEDVMMQPVLYDKVADTATILVSRRDAAQSELEEVKDRLVLQFKSQLEKATVQEIEAKVGMHRDYKEAVERYNEIAARAARWNTLKDSFGKRGYMLSELCGLYASGYWQKNAYQAKGGDRAVSAVRRKQLFRFKQ